MIPSVMCCIPAFVEFLGPTTPVSKPRATTPRFQTRGVNTIFGGKPVFGCGKPVANRFSVLLAFIEI